MRKWALLVAAILAGAAGARADSCFAVHVTLNGKAMAGPQAVTFVTKDWKKTVTVDGRCIAIPAEVKDAKSVDVVFSVEKNRIYLSSIAAGFFDGPWDVKLEDKTFGKYAKLPTGVQAKDACLVTFHVGEPEIESTIVTCRTRE